MTSNGHFFENVTDLATVDPEKWVFVENGDVKQPPNVFILFRMHLGHLEKTESQTKLSKKAGMAWKSLSDEQKAPYWKLHAKLRTRHEQLYPGFTKRQRSSDGRFRRAENVGPSKGKGKERAVLAPAKQRRVDRRSVPYPTPVMPPLAAPTPRHSPYLPSWMNGTSELSAATSSVVGPPALPVPPAELFDLGFQYNREPSVPPHHVFHEAGALLLQYASQPPDGSHLAVPYDVVPSASETVLGCYGLQWAPELSEEAYASLPIQDSVSSLVPPHVDQGIPEHPEPQEIPGVGDFLDFRMPAGYIDMSWGLSRPLSGELLSLSQGAHSLPQVPVPSQAVSEDEYGSGQSFYPDTLDVQGYYQPAEYDF